MSDSYKRTPDTQKRTPGTPDAHTPKPITTLICGAGLMGRWHAHAVNTHAVSKIGGKVVGVIDRDENAAYALALRYGANTYTSFGAALLDFPDVGAQKTGVIHICTPLHTHIELVTQALDAGWHVICEKPLADTAEETTLLYKTAAQMGRLLIPVHQFPFQDGALKAQAWIAAGKIGQIVGLEARFYSAGADHGSTMSPNDVVKDILPHPLSLIHKFFVGRDAETPSDLLRKPPYLPAAKLPNSGEAKNDALRLPLPEFGEGAGVGSVHRPNTGELRAYTRINTTPITLTISMNARPTLAEFTILGSNGTIHLDLYHGYAVLERGQVSRIRKILHPFDLSLHTFTSAAINLLRRASRREPAYPGLRTLIKSAYETIHMRSPTPISPDEAIWIARMRDSLIQGE